MSEIKNKKHILVTGIQRSGTTFTSTILGRAPLIIYLPEPFNPDYGIEGTSKHFPIIDMQNLNDRNKFLLKDLFTYKARYKKIYTRDSIPKKVIKYIFSNRANIRYRLNGIISKNNQRFLIKDPDAAFLSEYMVKKHNCQALSMVRHPCAVLCSFQRLGWAFDFTDIMENIAMLEEHFSEYIPLIQKDSKTIVEQVGLLWVIVNKMLNIFSQRNNNWMTVIHENLCREPEKTFQNIFDWAGIHLTENIRIEINRKTNSNNPILAQNNKLHDFSRDTVKLVDYWKKEICITDRNVLRGIVEPVSSLYYNDTTWS